MGISKSEREHNRIVMALACRLQRHGYDEILTHISYRVHDAEGECDILARRGKWRDYYEVKARHNSSSRRHAHKQLMRWRDAYPEDNCRMVYVAPNKQGKWHGERIR